MKKFVFIGILLVFSTGANAQKKITLEDIYKNNVFSINSIRGLTWMKDGDYYTSLESSEDGKQDIIKNSTATGEVVEVLVDGSELIPEGEENAINFSSYDFDQDETKVLLSSESEQIYRRSSKAINYIFDIATGSLELLVEGQKQSYATFSPDGSKVAFVRNNNLYFKDLDQKVLTQVTYDGEFNKIINGFADWVYEEELSLSKSFFWSPDGSKIAFLKFDESDVPVYNMQKWNGLYPEDYRFKYPKAGEKNSVVSLHIYELESGETKEVKIGSEKDVYLARLQWLPKGQVLSVIRLNRLQNTMDIFHHNCEASETKLIYTEKSDTYIDIDQVDDLTYLENDQSFIISSETSGFKHLYHYHNDGELIRQITNGLWSVTDFVGIDEKKKVLYYTSTEVSSIERHLYVVSLKGKGKRKLTSNTGVNRVSFSKDYKYYINTHSNFHQPSRSTLHKSNGRVIKVLSENDEYHQKSRDYGFASTEYFYVPIDNGDSLNAYMMKPVDFEENKKYPVLMNVYGGPGSQRVQNSWNGNMWHQLLTQKGYIVVCVDNRGTGGKGKMFQHITYKNLGKYETEDQISAARFLAEMPFVDENRIGIWGWSYGGYMSSLCLMLGNDVFKAAIAVAPVTSWRFYDTIYTERYLQKPEDNPSGYDEYSPINHVDKLQGNFLLIHGTGDDNVHFQNAVELHDALIEANKQFESFYYPNRNHGIYGGNTRLHLYTMMTRFILENL
jgi:dipeptidyl-peptidase-4